MTTPESPAAGQFDDHLGALAEMLAAEGIDTESDAGIPRRNPGAPTPMSFSQELIWLLDRATPGLTAYNMPVTRRVRGALDVKALASALDTLVTRHEVLRTRFADDGGAHLQIVDAPAPFKVSIVEAAGANEAERVADAQRITRERARTPFDLAQEHLFRATLVRIAPDDHVLLLETHHIVMDGWSINVLMRELAEAYVAAKAGKDNSLPVPQLQYGDYAAWQRAQLAGPRLDALLEFWRKQLGDATDPLSLPTDKRRTSSSGFSGARESITLDVETVAALKRMAQNESVTVYMVLLSAYGTVLHRYTGKQNILIGSGSAGRTHAETEHLIGYVNNTLVQRVDLSGDPTFRTLLARVRASALGAYDHQDIPLEKLVLELRREDTQRSHAPLFDVVLTMQDTLAQSSTIGDLTLESFGADLGATKFDITLLVSERDGEMRLTSQYRSELYTPETMKRFLGHLREVLAAGMRSIETRVSAIDVLTDEEHAQLKGWNETDVDEGSPATLSDLFEAQVARVPQHAAVAATASGDTVSSLTFAELNQRANQLANYLRSLGAGPDVPIGLLMDNSADALVALLGILKSGGAYTPLSVDAPATRLAQQLEECGASVVVTSVAASERLPTRVKSVLLDDDGDVRTLQAQPESNPASIAVPDNLAYVLFTSGSTGVPKGVAVTHANAVHYARAVSRVLGGVALETAGDGFAQLDGWQFGLASTLAADLGNTSLLVSLLAGGTLHVLGKQVTTEPARFAQYMHSNPLDVIKITPSHLMALAAGKTGAELSALLPRRWVVTGGETLRLDVARIILGARTARLLNHYGPTETTVGVCTFEVTETSLATVESVGVQSVPVGSPLANTRVYVIDERGKDQPIAIPGELCIGGAGVARGYLKRDDLTAERFTDLQGDRVYRTGDRVRRLENGAIEFLGRADEQVKIRGYRVELGEVAHALRGNPGVQDAFVVLHTREDGDPLLVGYVVAVQGGYAVSHSDRPSAEKLIEWVAAQLPEYMVPSAVVLLDALPLTANGKVDIKALPAPDATASATTQFVEPRTSTEKELAAIWADVFKKDRVGLTDNFIALGGHSLMAIRVLGRISKTFGVRLTLRALFDAPTVEQLASALDKEKAKAGAPTAGGIGSISRDAHRIGRPAAPANGGDGSGGKTT